VLLEWAAKERRVLVTIDTDFGGLLFVEGLLHSGVVRLPDVLAGKRIELMAQVLGRYSRELEAGAVITVRRGRIRISRPTSQS
jgi:predicted nuclease of predicted toxin-antitoxin system